MGWQEPPYNNANVTGKKTVSWFSQQVTHPFKVIDVGEFHDVSWSIAIVAGLILSLNYFFKVI
jgi:hypothetical protein